MKCVMMYKGVLWFGFRGGGGGGVGGGGEGKG